MTSIPWDDLMDAAGDSDFAPIPQGDYDVKIVSSEATKSSTDKPMWKITVAVEGGPHEGRKIWTQQTLTMDNNNALNVFFRQMAAAGLTSEFFKTKPTNQQIADALLGRRFRARVQIRNYMGQDRNEIKNWSPPRGAVGAPPPGAPATTGTPPPPPSTASTATPPPPPSTQAAPPSSPASPPSTPEAPGGQAPPPPPPPPPTTQPQPQPVAASTPQPDPTPDNEPAPPANEPGPPANEPAPPSNAAQPQPVTAAAGPPPQGDASAWVVEQRQTGSMEQPPF